MPNRRMLRAAARITVGVLVVAGARIDRAGAEDAESVLKAQFLSAPADQRVPMVRINSATVTAGLRQYLVRGGQNTQVVAMYSMDATIPADPSALLTATGVPGRTGLPSASPAVHLASSSAQIGTPLTDSTREAGAVQIAIWHFTNGVTLDATTVPDPDVRARAAVLVADTKRAEGVPNRAAGLKLSAFANGGGFSDVRVDVRVGISDAPDQSFDDPQQLEVNLDGVWYRACTAQSNRLTARDRLDRTGSGCPGSNGRSDDRNNAAVIHVDRRARTRTVRVLWNVQADPGLVFLPDRRSEPVVSAGRIATSVVAAIDVEPAGFGGILDLLQARVVGLLSAAGGLGLVFFFVLLYLLFKVKDVGDWLVGHAMRKVHGRVRAARSARGAITTTAPAPPVSALPPSNEVPLSE